MLLHGEIVDLRKDDMVTTSETIMTMVIIPDDREESPLIMTWYRPHKGQNYYSQFVGMNYDEAFQKAKVGSKVSYMKGCAGIIVDD